MKTRKARDIPVIFDIPQKGHDDAACNRKAGHKDEEMVPADAHVLIPMLGRLFFEPLETMAAKAADCSPVTRSKQIFGKQF